MLALGSEDLLVAAVLGQSAEVFAGEPGKNSRLSSQKLWWVQLGDEWSRNLTKMMIVRRSCQNPSAARHKCALSLPF